MFLQSEYLALSDGAKPYIQTFRWGRVESDLWSSSPLWTITSDHFYAPISQEFYGSPAHFCTSYSSPPSLLSKGSCLFRFTSSTGNPLWMTHCKHFLPNNANRPAGQQPQRVHNNKHTHTYCTHVNAPVCISYPVGDEVEQWGWTWHLKSRSNYFSRCIKVSRSGNSYELCSFDTADVSRGDRQTIKTTEKERKVKVDKQSGAMF